MSIVSFEKAARKRHRPVRSSDSHATETVALATMVTGLAILYGLTHIFG